MIFFTNIKSAILAVSVIGLLVFTPVFALTFVNQKAIADSAKQFIVEKTKEKYADYKSKISEHPSAEKALGFLKNKYEEKFDTVKEDVKNLDKIISAYIDALCETKKCNLKKEDKEKIKASLLSSYESSIKENLTKAVSNIDDLLKNKAQEVLANILTDLRIFSGTNLAIFTFILLTTLLAKAELLKALRLPTILLTVTSFLAIFIYVCEQNWFYTVLYSNYWGVGYISLVTFIFSFLVDIVMNKGRLTELTINLLGSIRIF